MTTVNAKAAREQFSTLISSVARGESVTITRRGKAIARLSPVLKQTPRRLPDLTDFRMQIKPTGPEVTITDLRNADRY